MHADVPHAAGRILLHGVPILPRGLHWEAAPTISRVSLTAPPPPISLSLFLTRRNLLHHNETPLWCVARLCDPSAPLLFSMASCMEMSINYMRPQGTCGHRDALKNDDAISRLSFLEPTRR